MKSMSLGTTPVHQIVLILLCQSWQIHNHPWQVDIFPLPAAVRTDLERRHHGSNEVPATLYTVLQGRACDDPLSTCVHVSC